MAGPPPPMISYQGFLNAGGGPANGVYDFRVAACDALTGGRQLLVLTNGGTGVSNGLVNLTLDMSTVFTGADRWLDISVRSNGNGAFTAITPRQPVTFAPYAVSAGSVPSGTITTAMLSAGAVTTDKIATGAVKLSQIDDAGGGAYAAFAEGAARVGLTNPVPFADVFQMPPTNSVSPTMSFQLNGAARGTVVGFSGNESVSAGYSFVVQVLLT
jgi:hypothetical protein